MDIQRYQELKNKKVISLVKAGDAYAVAYKKFDPQTGEALPDEVLSVNIAELEAQKVELAKQIKEIDAFLADCKAIV